MASDQGGNGWTINLHPNLRRRFGGSVEACQRYCDEHKIPINELNNAYFQAARRFVPTGNGGMHKRPPETKFHKLGKGRESWTRTLLASVS